MAVNIIDYYLLFRDGLPQHKKEQFDINHAKMQKDLIAFDVAYLFWAEMNVNASMNLYTENLLDFDVWEPAVPLVDTNYDLSHFISKNYTEDTNLIARKSPFITDNNNFKTMQHIFNEKKNSPLNAKRAVYLTFKGFYRMQNLFWFSDLD